MGEALCGSWLACDAVTSVCQSHRSDAIAGKPAPTLARSHIFLSRRLTERSPNLLFACAAALARTGHRSSPEPASAPGTSHG
ncbi:hypothetical protein BFW87_13230 [Pseudomonas fluorescens]|uniref:Uncharacterized protein n=1 Tax=Pseudomonas fluorescens TaxID=294 RepID=A0A1T2YRQ6_PSEFL|nr:hypothetical protein BFW87_13230 [Pseudomonas fluorescens]